MTFPDQFRVQVPGYTSSIGDTYGVFIVPSKGDYLYCIACDGSEVNWEHVSVSVRNRRGVHLSRCPTWEQMCQVKDLFWSEEEAVMQLHPPRSEYVNVAKFCLHLWRPANTDAKIHLPPRILV
jgi:hypothetical protein